MRAADDPNLEPQPSALSDFFVSNDRSRWSTGCAAVMSAPCCAPQQKDGPRCGRFGPVAQRIEQQPSKLKVGGSSPPGVANKIRVFLDFDPLISSQELAWEAVGKKPHHRRKYDEPGPDPPLMGAPTLT